MARIRTIKPEFWTSEQIVECSPTARLLFIGMWTFCDDAGIHPVGIKRLKMEVFPGDTFTDKEMQDLVDELVNAGLITSYRAEGLDFWQVRGWKHQKIDRPTYRYPAPQCRVDQEPCLVNSESARRELDEASPPEGSSRGRESKGVESKGVDGEGQQQRGVSSQVDRLCDFAAEFKLEVLRLVKGMTVEQYADEAVKWAVAREKKPPVDLKLNLVKWMQGAKNQPARKSGKQERRISDGHNNTGPVDV